MLGSPKPADVHINFTSVTGDRASLVAQSVKNLPAVQESSV